MWPKGAYESPVRVLFKLPYPKIWINIIRYENATFTREAMGSAVLGHRHRESVLAWVVVLGVATDNRILVR